MGSFIDAKSVAALEWIARLVSIPALIAGVAVPINQLTQRGGTVEVLVDEAVRAHVVAPGAALSATSAVVQLSVNELPWWLRLLSEGQFALTWIAIGFGALMLSRVMGRIMRGDPFDQPNARRIALIAVCVLVGAIGGPLLEGVAATATLDRLGLTSDLAIRAGISMPLTPLAIAGLVLVVAETFRRGSQLTKDVEGLV